MQEKKICKDCAHYKRGQIGAGDMCTLAEDMCTRTPSVDLVTGEPHHRLARTERFGMKGDSTYYMKYFRTDIGLQCGVDAVFFEPVKHKWWKIF